ncbi:LptF/LptG family permease [Luteibaculum oceani]|uniref:LptF/LptG family permease n=1 Tax=Luteibaculum oceani TaxID=1294296 RepID=UPI0014774505|nr:LptF/LptG family permease [Luteibaculum oceani]
MFNKLSILTFRAFFGPFLATFFLTLFILVMQFVWKYIDDLMGKGLEFTVVAELLLYATANLVTLALPLGILLASIMTFGNMAEKYELVALKSSGLSLFRIMRPMLILVCILTLSAFLFSNYASPVANLKFKTLLWDVTEQKPALELKDNIFYNGIEGYSIRVKSKDNETGQLNDVLIYDHREENKGNTYVIRAEYGFMSKSANGQLLLLTLYNGDSYEEVAKNPRMVSNFPHVRNNFKKQIISFDLSGFNLTRSDENLFKQGYQMLNYRQLEHVADSLDQVKERKIESYLGYLERSICLTADSAVLKEPTSPATFGHLYDSDVNNIIIMAQNQIRNAKAYAQRTDYEDETRQKTINRYRVEKTRKVSLSLACIILFFIGGPLGAIIKKGGMGMPVVFAVIFFLVFHVLSMSGEKMAIANVVSVHTGMFLSYFVLVPIAIFVTIKANQDSALFDAASYQKLLSKIPLIKKTVK